MKNHILPAIKLTALLLLLLTVVYPLAVWTVAQFSPNKGKGATIADNKNEYYVNIGQSFTADQYFHSRPSAVGYNAAVSGGSNKGPSNKEYIKEVQTRIDSFLIRNPMVQKAEIPVDMVTASGSGLDPHISVQGAKVQIKRIAEIRGLEETTLYKLIDGQVEKPRWGLLGPEKINVLKLNIALDAISLR